MSPCHKKKCQLTSIMLCSFFWIFWPLSWDDRLSLNVGTELPLYAAEYLTRVQITNDLVMQALLWLYMVWYRVV